MAGDLESKSIRNPQVLYWGQHDGSPGTEHPGDPNALPRRFGQVPQTVRASQARLLASARTPCSGLERPSSLAAIAAEFEPIRRQDRQALATGWPGAPPRAATGDLWSGFPAGNMAS